MKITRRGPVTAAATLAMAGTSLALAGCGGSSSSGAAPAASAASAAPAAAATSAAPAGLTCAQVTPALTKALSDLKDMRAKLQEAWVSGGDQPDLQTLMDTTQGAASGTDSLNTDAATFGTDARNYLSANSPYLAPGWQVGYDQVTSDIDAMATDCGFGNVPTAPPS